MKNKLTKKQRLRLVEMYQTNLSRLEIQEKLSEEFKVTKRTIRNYAREIGVTGEASNSKRRVMTYDIETSRVRADVWGTGKTYITHVQLKSHTTIISIAWKWLGEDKVNHVKWDKDHCDKKLMTKFLKEYNKADMVIGQNNNSFDNKLIATRAAYHRLFVNRFVKSFDIYRQAKSVFRLQSYSMAFMARYFGLTLKQSHEGLHMWDMIEHGNKSQQKEYLKKMVDYNIGDIITTEELYLTLLPYLKPVMNTGVQLGNPKWSCPETGSLDVELKSTTWTPAGTVQRIMYCSNSDIQYKISNVNYMNFLQRKMY